MILDIEFKPLEYGYANARAHGLFSKLLTKQQLYELVQMPSTITIIENLSRTSYKKELTELGLKYKDVELLEFALTKNFIEFCKIIEKITPKKAKPIIHSLFTIWDIKNLKLLILAKKQNTSFEQVQPYFVPIKEFNIQQLKKLYETKNSSELYSLLKTTEIGKKIFSIRVPGLTTNLANTFKKVDQDTLLINSILSSLDYYYYIALKEAILKVKKENTIEKFISSFADEKNIQTLIRLADQNMDENILRNYLVPGGSIPEPRLVNAYKKKEIFAILSSLNQIINLEYALEEAKKTKNVAELESAISIAFAKRRLKLFRGANLSLSVILAALFFKEKEIENIRKIVRAKLLGLNKEEIEKMLIIY